MSLYIFSKYILSKVGSVRVIQCGCILMIIISVIGKLSAAFTVIPNPVIGAILTIMFGIITAVGLSSLQFVDLSSMRNLFVLGVSIFIGMVIPHWTRQNKTQINTGNNVNVNGTHALTHLDTQARRHAGTNAATSVPTYTRTHENAQTHRLSPTHANTHARTHTQTDARRQAHNHGCTHGYTDAQTHGRRTDARTHASNDAHTHARTHAGTHTPTYARSLSPTHAR